MIEDLQVDDEIAGKLNVGTLSIGSLRFMYNICGSYKMMLVDEQIEQIVEYFEKFNGIKNLEISSLFAKKFLEHLNYKNSKEIKFVKNVENLVLELNLHKNFYPKFIFNLEMFENLKNLTVISGEFTQQKVYKQLEKLQFR